MSDFHPFKVAVSKQFDKLAKHQLFVTDVSKDSLWETYLESFLPEDNPIFRERREYDCNCCKQFIRAGGNVVAFIDGKIQTIWDIKVPAKFQRVADAMAELVRSQAVAGIYLHSERHIGTDKSRDGIDNIVWEHFHQVLPRTVVKRGSDIATLRGKVNTNQKVLRRSLDEISQESIEIVSELIDQGSLYRGTEHKRTIDLLKRLRRVYGETKNQEEFLWTQAVTLGAKCSIRNTVIGTLLVDISEGTDLEVAVKKYEDKVAPHNYKRSSALVTQKMIENAQAKVNELGIEDSLPRRFAVTEDLTINNVLFADRTAKQVMLGGGLLTDMLEGNATQGTIDFGKIEEVAIDKFIADILPKAHSVELYLENKHEANLVSLIAPVHAHAQNILKWDNNFSWSYNGEVTDSEMRQNVKKAGGSVDGVLRFSIQWNEDGRPNTSDLDAHARGPKNEHIYFVSKGRVHSSSGMLDVDITQPRGVAVENIIYTDLNKMPDGEYAFSVHNYRQGTGKGFRAELEFNGKILSFQYDKKMTGKARAVVGKIKKKGNTLTLVESMPTIDEVNKEVWGLQSNNFHKVSMAMLSPNHWDGQDEGNKHFFFMLENCKNPDDARGLYNEFLTGALHEHRKVFEMLGAKLKAAHSDQQLSGLGFSSTQRNEAVVRVRGSFNRVIKLKF